MPADLWLIVVKGAVALKRQPLLRRDRQESGVSAGADFGNGLLKHSKDPFLKGLRFLNSLRSDNVAEPTTDLSRCKQFPFPQDSTLLITPDPGDFLSFLSPESPCLREQTVCILLPEKLEKSRNSSTEKRLLVYN